MSENRFKSAIKRMWNTDSDRIFIPKAIGFGITINFHALLVKIGIFKNNKIDDIKKSLLILRELNLNDEQAFLNGLKDWSEAERSWFTFVWKPEMSHAAHLKALVDNKDQSKISQQFVPSTMLYGFVNDVIVGRFNIRHKLNENLIQRGGHVGYAVNPRYRGQGFATIMFKQGLVVCKELGLTKILITCSDDNVASWKIIEKFNGALENKVFDESKKEYIRRYWIDI